uniref:Ig-like domain-containing protein n=1 Tax=Gopherus evgoodei TaxID=1825980 RepID=A0A8C4XXJ2_9SAUR
MGLLSYSPGCDVLEIIYPSTILILKEGDPLTLNCTVWHEQKQSSDLKAYWCKLVENQRSCAKVGKELERLLSTKSLNPQARVSLSLLLQIHNVSHSDSGSYQCRASGQMQHILVLYICLGMIKKKFEGFLILSPVWLTGCATGM